MLKKVLSIMLALAMCATLVVVPVSADATGTVLFEEDFSDATAAIARFEQYGPNTGTDTFLVKEFWGTKATEGASLNFTGSSNGHKFDINAPRAAIADSNWSDFRLEFDYTTGPVANSYVMLRMDENYNGIEIQLGAGTGTAYTYELVNGISTMTDGTAKYDHWGNITYGEAAYRNWNDNYANRHAVIEIKGTTLTSSIYDGENLISTAVAENIQTPSAGKIVFAVNNEQNTFDNIVVTDLSSNDPVSITPANGTNNVSVSSDVVLTYGKNVTEAMADAVTVSPETSYTPSIDGNTLTLDFDGLEYNTTYTVTSGDFTSSFKTEMNMEDVLFYEDFTDATASLAKFEQYGPNTGTDTFLVKEFWGTKATEGASLN
ncbi:MAG: Ig-like domain-containing protein, partial [Clostridia bacterium]|nr:Ig-like domain-containing protein [Clostridia bacterium]